MDEVGNARIKNLDHPDNTYLSLTGVIVDYDYVVSTLYPEMEALKAKYFLTHHQPPDEPVLFHREDIVGGRYPFESLREVDSLGNAFRRNQFDDDLLDYLRRWEYTVITVCLDKRVHTIDTNRIYDPYQYCLEVMLERYALFLRRSRAIGDVMAESRGGTEDTELKKRFVRLSEDGAGEVNATLLQQVLSSHQLKIKTKPANIPGLQLADLLAHDSRSDVLQEHGLLERSLHPFGSRVIAILQSKYDQREGKLYGKILRLKQRRYSQNEYPDGKAAHLQNWITCILAYQAYHCQSSSLDSNGVLTPACMILAASAVGMLVKL